MNGVPGADRGVAAFVLAGGKSSRMGQDKALLEIAGQPLIERTVDFARAVAHPVRGVGGASRFASLNLDAVEDDFPGQGPLGGIATALRATNTEWNLILACDLPYLTREWLEYLTHRSQKSPADAVVPSNLRQNYEPLCACYRKRCALEAANAVGAGHLKVQEFIAGLDTAGRLESVEPAEWKRFDSTGRLFKNMNQPPDYEEAKRALGERAKS
jgi:molybdopterin-guanine dinucleotide biosynthesis protein A